MRAHHVNFRYILLEDGKEYFLLDKLPTLSLDEAIDLLASDGMLIKRPILIKDGKVLQIGYRTPYQDLNL